VAKWERKDETKNGAHVWNGKKEISLKKDDGWTNRQ
jgi:hypothetical protein